MTKKILVSSSIVVEKQFFVDTIAQVNQAIIAHRKAPELAAGKTINGSRFLTPQHQIFLLSKIGPDNDGQKALSWLKKNQFQTKFIQTTTKANTGQVIVLTNQKGRSAITVYLGAGNYIQPLDNLAQFDAFYLDTSIPLKTLYTLLQKKTAAKPCLVDFPNKHHQFKHSMLQYVTFTMPNRYEAEQLTDTSINSIEQAFQAAEKLKKFTPHSVIITLDKDGCVVLNEQIKQHVPALKNKVVDTTGAGDIFRGTFFNQYLATNEIMTSLKFATQAAGFSVSIQSMDQSIQQVLKKFY